MTIEIYQVVVLLWVPRGLGAHTVTRAHSGRRLTARRALDFPHDALPTMPPTFARSALRRARPTVRHGALRFQSLALFAIVLSATSAETTTTEEDTSSALDVNDDPASPPTLPTNARASFPLIALSGDKPGEVQLRWTPPRTARVFPSTNAEDVLIVKDDVEITVDGEKDTETSDNSVDVSTTILNEFKSASLDASKGRTYDLLIGACLSDTTNPTVPNQMPYAPSTCASSLFLENSESENEITASFDATNFFASTSSPREITGTSFTVTGLTPGARYAFRIVTSGAPEGVEDANAVSGVAVALASGESSEDVKDKENTVNSKDSDVLTSSSLSFCGASQNAFPNGTALLHLEALETAAACCQSCASTVGCNAWSFCGDGNFEKCKELGLEEQCWLMFAPRSSAASVDTGAERLVTQNVLRLSPWIGGILDPDNVDVPDKPTGLRLELSDTSDSSENLPLDADVLSTLPPNDAARLCLTWDMAPELPNSLAANFMTANYVVRSAVTKQSEEDGDDDSTVTQSEDFEVTLERSAFLETKVCVCDGLDFSMSVSQDTDSDSSNTVSVMVSVIAENEAGRSEPAELVFSLLIETSRAMKTVQDSSEKEKKTCPSALNVPLFPPVSLTATRLADDAIFVDWAPPPFDLEQLEVYAQSARDTGNNNGRRLLQDETDVPGEANQLEPDSDSDANPNELLQELSPTNLGYQVVWRSWVDASETLKVSALSSVTLTDSEVLKALAAAPCGEEETSEKCFYAPLATSLRLEGLPTTGAFVIGVRVLTPSGTGPLSAPVVVRAKGVHDDLRNFTASDDRESNDGTSQDVSSDSSSDVSETSSEVLPEPVPQEPSNATSLPTAPPLIPPPMYEAERIGAVYETINRPVDNYSQQNSPDNFSAQNANGSEVITETEEYSSQNPGVYGGVGGFDAGYGGFGGGYPFLGGGYGGYRGNEYYNSGSNSGGNQSNFGPPNVNVNTGAVVVSLNINLGNVTQSEARRLAPTPPPPPVTTPPQSPSPSPLTEGAIDVTDNEGDTARLDSAARAESSAARDEDSTQRDSSVADSSSRGAATVRVGGGETSDDTEDAADTSSTDTSSSTTLLNRATAVVRLNEDDNENSADTENSESSAARQDEPFNDNRREQVTDVKLLDREENGSSQASSVVPLEPKESAERGEPTSDVKLLEREDDESSQTVIPLERKQSSERGAPTPDVELLDREEKKASERSDSVDATDRSPSPSGGRKAGPGERSVDEKNSRENSSRKTPSERSSVKKKQANAERYSKRADDKKKVKANGRNSITDARAGSSGSSSRQSTGRVGG